jgi:hypothetical protein
LPLCFFCCFSCTTTFFLLPLSNTLSALCEKQQMR